MQIFQGKKYHREVKSELTETWVWYTLHLKWKSLVMNSTKKLHVLDTINPNWFCPWSRFCCITSLSPKKSTRGHWEWSKMHQIIKPTCPCRQLFIKITFAFMKIFDFLVKIAIFWSISLLIERFASRVTAQNQCSIVAVTRDANLSMEREMLKK